MGLAVPRAVPRVVVGAPLGRNPDQRVAGIAVRNLESQKTALVPRTPVDGIQECLLVDLEVGSNLPCVEAALSVESEAVRPLV